MAKSRGQKASQAEEAQSAPEVSGMAGDGNVDQIREILFGGQMREFDRRFTRLEEKLQRERDQLHEELVMRFEQMQQQLHDAAEDADAALRKEREERVAGYDDLVSQLDALEKDLANRLGKLGENSEAESKAIRLRLQEQVQSLNDTLRQQRDELTSSMDKENQLLHADKVSRESLSDMLQEVSLRLKAGFNLDGIG